MAQLHRDMGGKVNPPLLAFAVVFLVVIPAGNLLCRCPCLCSCRGLSCLSSPQGICFCPCSCFSSHRHIRPGCPIHGAASPRHGWECKPFPCGLCRCISCHPRRGSASVVAVACSLIPTPKIRHFDRSGSRCLRTAQRRNPLLYPYAPKPQAVVSPVERSQKLVKPQFHVSHTFQITSPLPINYPPPATIEIDTKRESPQAKAEGSSHLTQKPEVQT